MKKQTMTGFSGGGRRGRSTRTLKCVEARILSDITDSEHHTGKITLGALSTRNKRRTTIFGSFFIMDAFAELCQSVLECFTRLLRERVAVGRVWGKAAFTLAEVLITLGIIGVVAAMTMPALIQKHRKQVVETRLAKFYTSINQAITLSEVVNGPKEYWPNIGNGFETDDEGNPDKSKSIPLVWYNKYLNPYLKTVKVEVNHQIGNVMTYFPDGSLCLISGNSFQFWPEAKDFVDYHIDDSGIYNNNMKLSGIKYFTFYFRTGITDTDVLRKYHRNKGVEPYKYNWNGTVEMLKNDNSIGCKETVSDERAYCTALIQMNGWRIPKDYPLKF